MVDWCPRELYQTVAGHNLTSTLLTGVVPRDSVEVNCCYHSIDLHWNRKRRKNETNNYLIKNSD